MPEISLSEEHRERLEEVRRDVEAAYVDTYGHARLEDAIQYLLDTYTPPGDRETADAYDRIATAEYPQLQRVASDVPSVPGSGIDADEMRGRLLSELGPDALAAELASIADDEDTATGDGSTPTGDDDAATGDETTATESDGDADEATATGAAAGSDEGTPSAHPGENGRDGDGDGDTEPDAAGGLLATANELLREHEDKWRESDGETLYEVDLPDGSTEPARTKDDVRQLLFRHY